MTHENQEFTNSTNNTLSVLGGILIGALAGAATALLLAPQSGKDTRKQIQEKGIELRDRTTEMVDDTMAKVRMDANKITMNLKDRGREVAVDQLENVSEAAQAGKKAIENS
jgi:gas vesicle protein